VIVNPDSTQAKNLSKNVAKEFSELSWQIIEDFDFSNAKPMDLVIAIGGDGTLLRAVSLSLKYDVPVLGINMGTVGFMTEIEGEIAIDELNFYLSEPVRTEVRSMLEVDFLIDKKPIKYTALNDIVIARGSSVSMIETITEIDGIHLATYRGSGRTKTSPSFATSPLPFLMPPCRLPRSGSLPGARNFPSSKRSPVDTAGRSSRTQWPPSPP